MAIQAGSNTPKKAHSLIRSWRRQFTRARSNALNLHLRAINFSWIKTRLLLCLPHKISRAFAGGKRRPGIIKLLRRILTICVPGEALIRRAARRRKRLNSSRSRSVSFTGPSTMPVPGLVRIVSFAQRRIGVRNAYGTVPVQRGQTKSAGKRFCFADRPRRQCVCDLVDSRNARRISPPIVVGSADQVIDLGQRARLKTAAILLKQCHARQSEAAFVQQSPKLPAVADRSPKPEIARAIASLIE